MAAGDVDGDGKAEIILGQGAGAGSAVVVFDGETFEVVDSFFAFGTFNGGVFVGGAGR